VSQKNGPTWYIVHIFAEHNRFLKFFHWHTHWRVLHLTCDGIFSNRVIANCIQNLPVKELWKSVNIWRR